jgi:hypothetical protein
MTAIERHAAFKIAAGAGLHLDRDAGWPLWLVALAQRYAALRSPSQRSATSKINRLARELYENPERAAELEVLYRLGGPTAATAWIARQRTKR